MDMVRVNYETADGIISVEEWCEMDGYVEVSFKEGDCIDRLPVMNRKEWEKLKKQVDHVLSCMEDNYDE